MKQRILVTGANGFIGNHLCDALYQMGEDVFALTLDDIDSQYPSRAVLLEDADRLKTVIKEVNPDRVVHLAAIANVAYGGDIADIYRVNVCGTENLLDAVRSLNRSDVRVILTSTAGVYGNQDSAFYSEELPYKPANHYSFSKMTTEYLSQLYTEDFDITIIRPFNVIGTGQSTSFLIPKLIQHFVERYPILELGNIDSYRDFVDIDFMIEVLVRLIKSDSVPSILNVCSGNAHSCRDILGILAEIVGYTPEIRISSDIVRRNEVWRLIGDTTRLFEFLGEGLRPDPVPKILEKMIEEYSTHG